MGGKLMSEPKLGKGVIMGKNVQLGRDTTIWNYVIIGDDTKIGDGTRVGSFCDIGKDVVMGKNTTVQAHVTISNACRLGDNVFIGPNSSLLNDRFPNSGCLTPSVIENGSVVGGCVTVLPNVTVGKNAVVAAGSVVTKDVPEEAVVKGIPAEVMMMRKEYEAKRADFVRAQQ
jgi:UDP-2-acetamido-3-amino-2,3-dideoxy-glucuronate N-acetyltransferase